MKSKKSNLHCFKINIINRIVVASLLYSFIIMTFVVYYIVVIEKFDEIAQHELFPLVFLAVLGMSSIVSLLAGYDFYKLAKLNQQEFVEYLRKKKRVVPIFKKEILYYQNQLIEEYDLNQKFITTNTVN